MSAPRGRSILRWLALAGAGALVFLIPSTSLLDRGLPRWFAGAIGALSFPLLPLAWHVVGERARRRKAAAVEAAAAAKAKGKPAAAPAKGGLTAGDRFTLRLAAVALISCGMWFALDVHRTFGALWRRGAWIAEWGGHDARHVSHDRRLLDHVPADATSLIWVRAPGDLRGVLRLAGDVTALPERSFDAVALAFKKGEAIAVLSSRDVDALAKTLDSPLLQRWLGPAHLIQRRVGDDVLILVTPGWYAASQDRDAGTAPVARALIARLWPAPADAAIVAAMVPLDARQGGALRDAYGWVTVDGDGVAATATLRTISPAAATDLTAALAAVMARAVGQAPAACRAPVGALIGAVHTKADGAAVALDLRVTADQLGAVARCAIAGF